MFKNKHLILKIKWEELLWVRNMKRVLPPARKVLIYSPAKSCNQITLKQVIA